MFRLRSIAVLTTATLLTGLAGLPATATDQALTPVTAAAFTAALDQMVTATQAASVAGWTQQVSFDADTPPMRMQYDPAAKIAQVTYPIGKALTRVEITQTGVGYWSSLVAPDSATRAALSLLGRPRVALAFTPDADTDATDMVSVPAQALADLREAVEALTNLAVTTDPDGRTVYVFDEPSQLSDDDHTTLTLDATGALAEVNVTEAAQQSSGYALRATWDYTAVHLSAPAAGTYVTRYDLERAKLVVGLPRDLRGRADRLAKDAKAIAKRAHRAQRVRAGDVRAAAKQAISDLRHSDYGDFRVSVSVANVRNGVSIVAVNPYSHARVSVSVTVTAKGKVVVK